MLWNIVSRCINSDMKANTNFMMASVCVQNGRWLLLGLFMFLCVGKTNAQKTLEIVFCDQKCTADVTENIQVSIVNNQDTLIIPKVGKTSYLNPIDFYTLDLDPQKKSLILVENSKCTFPLHVPNYALSQCPEIEICITCERSKKQYRYYFYVCGSTAVSGFVPCLKRNHEYRVPSVGN
jgi:hypothetical protein